MPQPPGDIRYDRRVEKTFLDHFLPGGVAHSLVEYARDAPYPVDLQLRRNPKTGAEQASLYVGLASVLNVEAKPSGLALTAAAAFTGGGFGFHATPGCGWQVAAPVEEWAARWPDVEAYLEAVIPAATAKYATQEGPVQAAVNGFTARSRVMLDREVIPHFRDTPTKQARLQEIYAPIVSALRRAQLPGKAPASFGAECDLLGIAPDGQLLAVEVKPKGANTIPWAVAQATVYARVLQAWIDDDPEGGPGPGWRTVIEGMLAQRQRLGLIGKNHRRLQLTPRVVPVVAVQRGASQEHRDRMHRVQQALLDAGVGDPGLQMYQVSLSGRLDQL